MKNTIILILISVLFVLCNKEQNEIIVPQAHTVDKAEKLLLETSNEFGFNSFSALSQSHPENENIVISPINASLAFNSLIFAANDATAQLIKQFLRVNHLKDSSLTNGFDELNRLFSEIDESTKIEGTNTLITPQNFTPLNGFKKFADTRNYIRISKEINSLENEKNGLPVKIVNSMNFSAKIRFQKGVNELPFYNTPDEISFVKMVVAEAKFNHYLDPVIQAVELPLGRGNYNLLMIIPEGSQTIKDLTDKLDNRLINRIKSKFKTSALEVFLPMISLSGSETFNNILKKSSMNICFNNRKAVFSNLTSEDRAYLSDFEQTTEFSLQESSEAFSHPALIDKTSLLIDRPFLFVVYEKYSEAIILIGKITHL
ncbi:MAG: serpin family protein [Chloroflexia bacterium]|nr:serpin family protein [Chloroflexia bacterium]